MIYPEQRCRLAAALRPSISHHDHPAYTLFDVGRTPHRSSTESVKARGYTHSLIVDSPYSCGCLGRKTRSEHARRRGPCGNVRSHQSRNVSRRIRCRHCPLRCRSRPFRRQHRPTRRRRLINSSGRKRSHCLCTMSGRVWERVSSSTAS